MAATVPVIVGEEIKAQEVRLLDVFIIGPLMIWGGAVLGRRHPVAGLILAVSGVATVGYNARNYGRIRRRLAQRVTP